VGKQAAEALLLVARVGLAAVAPREAAAGCQPVARVGLAAMAPWEAAVGCRPVAQGEASPNANLKEASALPLP